MAVIREIEPIGISIPLRNPVRLASGVVATADDLVVRVTDSDGVTGWGESASAPTMTGKRLGGMIAAVRERIAPRLLRLDIDARPVRVAALAAMAGVSAARSAVEVALQDLLARRRGICVAALLGTEPQPVPVIRKVEADIGADAVAGLLADGITHIKVKVGLGAPLADARVSRDCRRSPSLPRRRRMDCRSACS